MNNERIESVDVLRGFAIILMVMGHLNFGSRFDYYIHAFHMPVWFFITGWFQDTRTLSGRYIKYKFRRLIVPYLVWGVLQYPIWIVFNLEASNKLEPLINFLWINTNLVMPIAGALWFLTCLFFAEIFFPLIQSVNHSLVKSLIAFFMIVTGYMLPTYFDIRLPWAIDVSFVSVGFIFIGFYLRKYCKYSIINNMFNLRITETCILGVFNTICIFFNGYINLRMGSYSSFVLFWINAISAILFSWNLCRIIESKFSHTFFVKELKFIGKNSIFYLVLNQLFVLIASKVIYHLYNSDIVVVLLIKLFTLPMILATLHFSACVLKSK